MGLSEILQIIVAILLFAATILVVNQLMKWITKGRHTEESPSQDGLYQQLKDLFHRRGK